MDIKIRNCNNIEEGEVNIVENRLNIKYGINGVGKSTIAKALKSFIDDKGLGSNSLLKLKPFKFYDQDKNDPEITGAEKISNVKIFNEAYVDEFVFQQDDLLKGSFDILIRNEDYELGLKRIEELIKKIKDSFIGDPEIEELLTDFRELSSSFGKPTKTGIHKSSKLHRAFADGNRILNIPPELEDYSEYIALEENYKWIKWQLNGEPFLDVTDNCPYCVSEIKEEKEKIKTLSKVYDSKSVENLNRIIEVFNRLRKYFSEDTKKRIDDFIKNSKGYTDDEVDYLREIRSQIDKLGNKFVEALSLGFISLRDVETVMDELEARKIKLELFNHLNSEETKSKVALINDAITQTLEKVGILQGQINKQKILIEGLISKYKTEIDLFLKTAGYPYSVDLMDNQEGGYNLKLRHIETDNEISTVTEHLSFGERNAFALVLFMYDAINESPDVIILDDPISSFDQNKKYAIIDMLFSKEQSLRDKTVLMLTHDFEPIVDMILHHRDRFEIPIATFLENNHGHLSEIEIQRSDIQTFIEVNKANINELSGQTVNKLVYLRRLFEIQNEKGFGYQLISNLLHRRGTPTLKEGTNNREMTPNEIEEGKKEIQKHITDFNYKSLLKIMCDDKQMSEIYRSSTNNYEKLHIYRIIFENKSDVIESKVIQKFINQAYHIENDYIYQLNPRKYQMVPQFVIDECDKAIDTISIS